MSKLWSVLAMLAIAGAPQRAHAHENAEPLPIDLAWKAPASCPDGSFLRRRIEQIVQGPQIAPARVEAEVERRLDGRFHLRAAVRTGETEEHRSIDAASCAALTEAFAVVVAFTLESASDRARDADAPADADVDAHASLPEQGSDPRVSPETPPPSAANVSEPADRPPPRAPRASRPAPSPMELALGLGGSMASGPMPEVSPGMVVSAALRRGRLRLGALGTFSFRRSAYLAPTAGVTLETIEAGAFAAYMVPLGLVALGPAANLEATYVHVRGFGIRVPWTSSEAWLTAVLGARVEARFLRNLGLFGRADLLLPIGAPTFSLTTRNDGLRLYDPPPVAMRFSLGAEFVLP